MTMIKPTRLLHISNIEIIYAMCEFTSFLGKFSLLSAYRILFASKGDKGINQRQL